MSKYVRFSEDPPGSEASHEGRLVLSALDLLPAADGKKPPAENVIVIPYKNVRHVFTRDNNMYRGRWAIALGVLHILMGIGAIGFNIGTKQHFASNKYGIWCGVIFALAGIFQIVSGKTKKQLWIGVSLGLCVLAFASAFPVIFYSVKSIEREVVLVMIHNFEFGNENKYYEFRWYVSLFAAWSLVGIVELNVAVISCIMAARALSFSWPWLTRMTEKLKTEIQMENYNHKRADKLGNFQITCGILTVTFNAVGITLHATNSSVNHGVWGGLLFIIGGSLLYMSGKSRIWMLVCYPTLIISSIVSFPVFVFSLNGLTSDVRDGYGIISDDERAWFPSDRYNWYEWSGNDYNFFEKAPNVQKPLIILVHVLMMIVTLVQLILAIVSAVQVGNCFKCDEELQNNLVQKDQQKKPLCADSTVDEKAKDEDLAVIGTAA